MSQALPTRLENDILNYWYHSNYVSLQSYVVVSKLSLRVSFRNRQYVNANAVT
jgi:hypothetical protein